MTGEDAYNALRAKLRQPVIVGSDILVLENIKLTSGHCDARIVAEFSLYDPNERKARAVVLRRFPSHCPQITGQMHGPEQE